MFSGIVEDRGHVVDRITSGSVYRLVIETSLDVSRTEIGDSVAVDGVCLTVVVREGQRLSFDIADETLRRTTLGKLAVGGVVNLERSLRVGQEIHGHFVFGHVDGCAELVHREDEQHSVKMTWRYPQELRGLFAEKGSVSLSGVSLTLGVVTPEEFTVYLIPHTLEVTTLSKLVPGDTVNLEVDMLARYVQAQLSGRATSSAGGK